MFKLNTVASGVEKVFTPLYNEPVFVSTKLEFEGELIEECWTLAEESRFAETGNVQMIY